ncbi:hypothetical protein E2C01_027417 [Portunus trituberculatus]|uniref:Uncharacterized protein n=1 Tax=Portunus trituberculatus TaxID=210409 RepID=A0A5B7EIP0_PORTR|nr:hypothetical protein [Portunus trituberculatus]
MRSSGAVRPRETGLPRAPLITRDAWREAGSECHVSLFQRQGVTAPRRQHIPVGAHGRGRCSDSNSISDPSRVFLDLQIRAACCAPLAGGVVLTRRHMCSTTERVGMVLLGYTHVAAHTSSYLRLLVRHKVFYRRQWSLGGFGRLVGGDFQQKQLTMEACRSLPVAYLQVSPHARTPNHQAIPKTRTACECPAPHLRLWHCFSPSNPRCQPPITTTTPRPRRRRRMESITSKRSPMSRASPAAAEFAIRGNVHFDNKLFVQSWQPLRA